MRIVASVLSVIALGGCGGDDGAPIDRPRDFGGARPVTLQVPTTFDDGQRYPLLVILHGYSVNAFIQQTYFRMGDIADTAGALVLAPEGTTDSGGKQFWNADPDCCNFDGRAVDDVAYLGGLIDDVMAAWPVDPARIDVVGHSNGAFMAYRLACDRADVVTAIAGLAGHAARSDVACAPVRPVSVLHLHGTVDVEIPYADNVEGAATSPGAVASVAAWADHNGCTGAPAAGGRKDLDGAVAGDETVVAITGGCPADGAAELWTLEGSDHIPQPTPTFPTELMTWLAAHPRR